MRLALGTVQFGLQYGVANINGQVSEDIAAEILSISKTAGIDTLDTAVAYGDSENCLGNIGVNDWRIFTKIPSIPINCLEVSQWGRKQFEDSLERLNVDCITGLMLHNPMQLLEGRGKEIWDFLTQLKLNKKVEKIGFSIYGPSELDMLWKDYQPDIVQAPFNILDQRMKKTGWFDKLNNNNVELHIRSVFLQGLLLMNTDDRSKNFNQWNYIWEKLDSWLTENNLTPLEAALGYVLNEKSVDRVIVGVDTVKQLEEVLAVSENVINTNLNDYLAQISTDDEKLINPSNWSDL